MTAGPTLNAVAGSMPTRARSRRPAWVIVPARDEAERIEACLAALAAAAAQVSGPTRVVVVDDGSTDGTAELARSALGGWGAGHRVIPGPAAGVGWARRTGFEQALSELAGGGEALLATTDADSQVAPDWLAVLHHRLDDGHVVIAGDVQLSPGADPRLSRARARRLRTRVRALPPAESGAAHPHFAGSNLAFAAETLRRLGPLPTPRSLEDEAILHRCRTLGIPVLRDAAAVVATSARLEGRAPGGLAAALTADAAALAPG